MRQVCPESKAVGLKVTACDEGQAPRVLLRDAARGLVVRAGALAHPAYVFATVYCAEPDRAPPDSAEAPATDASADTAVPTATTSPSQLLFLSTPDSPEVERPLILTSSTNEYLPPVKLKSRFSSIDQSKGPPISTSFSSKLKDLMKGRAVSSLDQLKSQSFPEGTFSILQENEQSSSDKVQHQPSILDSYSNLINSFSKSSSASLAKRLISLHPKQPHKGFENRAPAWKKRPTRRPSSPWLKLRSQPDEETRKSMPRSRHRAANAFDYNDPWTHYEDDPLSLHATDEPTDSNPWYTEGDPESPYRNNFPWRIKPPKKHNWKEGPHPLHHDRPSPSSIKHDSNKKSRFVPPIYEEDPALLLEWKKDRPRSKRPALPKLLLLLQDQDHNEPVRSIYSAHSVEDNAPWWLNEPYKSIDSEAIPWQPDYPAEYTADDGDSRSYSPANYIDDRMESLHVAPSKKRALIRPPWYRGSPSASLMDTQLVHASQKQPPSSKAQPFENYFYYSPTPLTERPLLTSTVRNSLQWSKGSNAKPFKLPLKLKKPKLKKPLEKSIHHYPSEPRYPSHLQSNKNTFSEKENYFPSKPQLPSGPHYLSESGNIPSEPHYPPETHYPLDRDNPSKPYFTLESDYPLKHNYPKGPLFPSEPDYPSEPYYSSEMENVPSEPHYPSEPDYPSEPYYPSVSENVSSEPYYPPEPHHPSKPQFPSGPHYPSESDYPSRPRYPSGRHYPSEFDYPSKYLQSSAPWKFLSELLLTHPSFRDSTHVIRIR